MPGDTTVVLRGAPAIVRVSDTEGSKLRLVCFAYAGLGPSLFRRWPAELPSVIDVWASQLPGHESRIKEQPAREVGRIVDEVVRTLLHQPLAPFALFGASLGALLAFETARRLAAAGAPPELLAVAACPAPVLHQGDPAAEAPPPEPSTSTVDDMFGALHPDGDVVPTDALRDLVEPVMRADLAVYASYAYREGPALPCPIVAYTGADDSLVPSHLMAGWRRETANFCQRELPGDHFFVRTDRQNFLAELTGALLPVVLR